jgi:Uma2 family endonuclease
MVAMPERLLGEYIWETPDDDGKRYEVLDGQLVISERPLVVHQVVLGNFFLDIIRFAQGHGRGEVVIGPVAVMLAEYDAVQPDMVYVSRAREEILSPRAFEGVPDLIIEITEPATAERDRGLKLQRYAVTGVPHYWIVDALEKTIEERILGVNGYGEPVTCRSGEVFCPMLFPGLEIEVARLWL